MQSLKVFSKPNQGIVLKTLCFTTDYIFLKNHKPLKPLEQLPLTSVVFGSVHQVSRIILF